MKVKCCPLPPSHKVSQKLCLRTEEIFARLHLSLQKCCWSKEFLGSILCSVLPQTENLMPSGFNWHLIFFSPIFHNQLSATVLYSTFEQVFSFVQFLSYRISYGTTYLAATSNAEKRRCTTQFKPTFSCNTASLYKRRNWSRFWRTIENVTDKETYWYWSACWHEDARNDEGASQMLSVDNSFQYLTIIVSPILDITHENAAALSKRPTWRMCVCLFFYFNLPPEARAAAWN